MDEDYHIAYRSFKRSIFHEYKEGKKKRPKCKCDLSTLGNKIICEKNNPPIKDESDGWFLGAGLSFLKSLDNISHLGDLLKRLSVFPMTTCLLGRSRFPACTHSHNCGFASVRQISLLDLGELIGVYQVFFCMACTCSKTQVAQTTTP